MWPIRPSASVLRAALTCAGDIDYDGGVQCKCKALK